MKNIHITDQIPAYLDGALTTKEVLKVTTHLKTCEVCNQELLAYQKLFEAFKQEESIQPSANIRTNFFEQIEKTKQEEKPVLKLPHTKQGYNGVSQLLKIAAGIALLLGSFFLGKFQEGAQVSKEIALLTDESLQLKQTAMLSLMENKSASRRIQGVNYVNEFASPDMAIVTALIDRMLLDENTNVRLTATEALTNFATVEAVKQAFIAALETEKDPGIQITIIQILVELQEKKAVKPLKKLLEKEETQPFIKNQIKSVLPQII